MMTNNIPESAIKVSYDYSNINNGYFHIWRVKKTIGPDRWAWNALGSGGEEDNQEEAIKSARHWIINNDKFKFSLGD